jgi:LmbE family N-acetylglucosaminyl deacetylase
LGAWAEASLSSTQGNGTLLVVLAHPDDEVPAAGTMMAQRARGDRVVVLWLTRGEMTEAFGAVSTEEVARRRMELAAEATRLLDVEHRFLSMPDTRLQATPEAALEVARVICDVRPDGLLTWGVSWIRGARHPDHEAAGKIARDAVTIARIAKAMAPTPPFRGWCPVFTYRDVHSALPPVAIDVSPYVDTIRKVGEVYHKGLQFGDPAWIDQRLRRCGAPFGLDHAEVFDAWESEPGVVRTLLPAGTGDFVRHPDRVRDG